jgi:pantoate--beta-alanine ligase
MLAVIQDEPLARVQYVSAAAPDTLEEAQGEIQRVLLSMAVYMGDTRLIDNVMLGVD